MTLRHAVNQIQFAQDLQERCKTSSNAADKPLKIAFKAQVTVNQPTNQYR